MSLVCPPPCCEGGQNLTLFVLAEVHGFASSPGPVPGTSGLSRPNTERACPASPAGQSFRCRWPGWEAEYSGPR